MIKHIVVIATAASLIILALTPVAASAETYRSRVLLAYNEDQSGWATCNCRHYYLDNGNGYWYNTKMWYQVGNPYAADQNNVYWYLYGAGANPVKQEQNDSVISGKTYTRYVNKITKKNYTLSQWKFCPNFPGIPDPWVQGSIGRF